MKLLGALLVTVFALWGADPANAKRLRVAKNCSEFDIMRPCSTMGTGFGQFALYGPESGAGGAIHSRSTVVGHPPGCPRSRFCGCGAALRVFGTPRRDLWLAANWLRFPRAAPAPRMVAARRGHVFVLEAHVSGDLWMVYDANSGGGATRIHVRPIRGYTIVNPHA